MFLPIFSNQQNNIKNTKKQLLYIFTKKTVEGHEEQEEESHIIHLLARPDNTNIVFYPHLKGLLLNYLGKSIFYYYNWI